MSFHTPNVPSGESLSIGFGGRSFLTLDVRSVPVVRFLLVFGVVGTVFEIRGVNDFSCTCKNRGRRLLVVYRKNKKCTGQRTAKMQLRKQDTTTTNM